MTLQAEADLAIKFYTSPLRGRNAKTCRKVQSVGKRYPTSPTAISGILIPRPLWTSSGPGGVPATRLMEGATCIGAARKPPLRGPERLFTVSLRATGFCAGQMELVSRENFATARRTGLEPLPSRGERHMRAIGATAASRIRADAVPSLRPLKPAASSSQRQHRIGRTMRRPRLLQSTILKAETSSQLRARALDSALLSGMRQWLYAGFAEHRVNHLVFIDDSEKDPSMDEGRPARATRRTGSTTAAWPR